MKKIGLARFIKLRSETQGYEPIVINEVGNKLPPLKRCKIGCGRFAKKGSSRCQKCIDKSNYRFP